MIASHREMARTLGGEVAGGQLLCPGPGPRDRSLSLKLSASLPDGFIAYSHAGDDWRVCRDYVRSRLGLDPDGWKRKSAMAFSSRRTPGERTDLLDNVQEVPDRPTGTGTTSALALWVASVDPHGTAVERYLASRALRLTDDIAGDVIRWNARVGAMIALFRNIMTGEPQAISRTFLDAEAQKIERKFLGPVGGAAVMLDPFDSVTMGLHIGEGIETCMAEWALRNFFEKFGHWPNAPLVRDAEPQPPNIDTENWVKSRWIAYSRARANG